MAGIILFYSTRSYLRATGWDESSIMDRSGETGREETDHIQYDRKSRQPGPHCPFEELQPSHRKLPERKHTPRSLQDPQDAPKSPQDAPKTQIPPRAPQNPGKIPLDPP